MDKKVNTHAVSYSDKFFEEAGDSDIETGILVKQGRIILGGELNGRRKSLRMCRNRKFHGKRTVTTKVLGQRRPIYPI